MISNKIQSFVLLISLMIFYSGCTTTITKIEKNILKDGKYDGEFPYADATGTFEEILNSVKLINSMAFFETYVFDRAQNIRFNKKDFEKIKKRAVEVEHFHDTFSGTGTVIYSDNEHALLLTCAHLLNFPDTTVTYFVNDDGTFSGYVESIIIKVKQTNFLPELSDGIVVNILAKDDDLDLALVGNTFSPPNLMKLHTLNFPIGNPAELNWGSLVYLFGYPLNNKLITRGIVSKPLKKKTDYFLLDAVINRGFSGGPVFAIRDGVPNFEFVGIIRSTFAEKRFLLKPSDQESYTPNIPYEGKIYVKRDYKFKYGVSKVIPVNVIAEFIKSNKDVLIRKGFFTREFFRKKTDPPQKKGELFNYIINFNKQQVK